MKRSGRLNTSTEPVTKTIKKNNLAVFSTNMKSISESKARKQIKSLKDDVSLFSRLFIACQAREGDLEEFFSHENQVSPPSLSVSGKLRLGK